MVVAQKVPDTFFFRTENGIFLSAIFLSVRGGGNGGGNHFQPSVQAWAKLWVLSTRAVRPPLSVRLPLECGTGTTLAWSLPLFLVVSLAAAKERKR
jgi:hypothetical protein